MDNRNRKKGSCFRCRALQASLTGVKCILGWPLSVSEGGFYCPGGGVRCMKPLTWGGLIHAQAETKREKDDDNQVSLPLL